jgi:hypothetical protein
MAWASFLGNALRITSSHAKGEGVCQRRREQTQACVVAPGEFLTVILIDARHSQFICTAALLLYCSV